MKTQTHSENMNLPAIARYLGVSPITIKRMLKDREIPAAKVRGQWLFKKSVIDEWLTRNSWSQVKTSTAMVKPQTTVKPVHPSVARLFAALDNFDFNNLKAKDWDDAKKTVARNRAKSRKEMQKIVALSEQDE